MSKQPRWTEADLFALAKGKPHLEKSLAKQIFRAQTDAKEFMPIVGDEKALLEDAIQAFVIEYALNPSNLILYPELWFLYSIPNARKTSKFTGHLFNLTGRRKGFPDLGLPVSRKPFFAYFLELKTYKAYQTKNHGCSLEQLEWHNKLRSQGNKVDVLWSVSEITNNLKNYLGYL